MRTNGFLLTGLLLSTATAAPIAASPQSGPYQPKWAEQSGYCLPALRIFDAYTDGKIDRDAAVRDARVAIDACRQTNPLGALLSLAQFEGVAGNGAASLAAAQGAVALAPSDAEAHRRLCLATSGAAKDAACAKAGELGPQSPLTQLTLGQFFFDRNQYAEAIVRFDKLVAAKPGYSGGWLERGRARMGLKDYDGAIADFDKGMPLTPAYSNEAGALARNKAFALLQLNRGGEALAVVDARLRAKPNETSSMLRRSEALIAMGRKREAYAQCSAVLKLDAKADAATKCMADAKKGRILDQDCGRLVPVRAVLPAKYQGKVYLVAMDEAWHAGLTVGVTDLRYDLHRKAPYSIEWTMGLQGRPLVPKNFTLRLEVDTTFGLSQADLAEYNSALSRSLAERERIFQKRAIPLTATIRSGAQTWSGSQRNQIFLSGYGSDGERAILEEIHRTGRAHVTLHDDKRGVTAFDGEVAIGPDPAADASTLRAEAESFFAVHQAAATPGWCRLESYERPREEDDDDW